MAAKDVAIGTWEASCVLGVHWTTVARMDQKGMISGRDLRSTAEGRVFRVYSLAECEDNYAEYEEVCRRNGGHSPRHPRTMAHMRHEVLERLQNEPAKIALKDAVSGIEAAEILGVCHSFVPRLVAAGEIEGRVLWSGRPDSGGSRLWIYSRKSCDRNREVTAALQSSGGKVGRPRSSLDQ